MCVPAELMVTGEEWMDGHCAWGGKATLMCSWIGGGRWGQSGGMNLAAGLSDGGRWCRFRRWEHRRRSPTGETHQALAANKPCLDSQMSSTHLRPADVYGGILLWSTVLGKGFPGRC